MRPPGARRHVFPPRSLTSWACEPCQTNRESERAGPCKDDAVIIIAGLGISPALVPHPLLGEAHAIELDGQTLTHVSRLDWDRPAEIPTIAEPGRLPPGSGGALLNELALRA